MEAEDDMEESVMKDENRSQKSENREPIKEPIMVNLYERPTPENI